MNLKRGEFAVLPVAGLALLMLGGCASKNYVRQQTAPLVNQVNNLDQLTAKNTNDIKSLSTSTRRGISEANASSAQAMQTAQAASQKADNVSGHLQQTSNQVEALDHTVANLDNYKQVSTSAVHFGFNHWNLTAASKSALQGVVNQLEQDPHTILEVTGYTDSIGPAGYNYKLSQWRADSVVRFVEEHGIPEHRIFLVGLGKNNFVASNRTRAGRAQNRRVDLQVLSNSLGQSAAPSSEPASQQP
ncbi:MAG: OmpA family protein [Terriglobales bacterium]